MELLVILKYDNYLVLKLEYSQKYPEIKNPHVPISENNLGCRIGRQYPVTQIKGNQNE